MRENPIRLKQIQQRQQHVKTSNLSIAAIAESKINTTKSIEKRNQLIEEYFSICRSTDVIEKSSPKLVDYFNERSDDRAVKCMLSRFETTLAPAIEDTNMALSEISKIEDDTIRESCTTAIADCAAIDTLLNNHEKISKRFDVNGYISNHQFYDVEETCANQFCEWIDTYQIPAKDKGAIALEETRYAFEKGSLIHDRSTVVQTVMEYFLVPNSITTDEARGILERCQFIDKDDTKNIRYIFGEAESDEVKQVIDQCKTDD